MQIFINTIKYIFESNVINFLIMVYVFAVIYKKMNLKEYFNKAVKDVENNIQKSEDEKNNSIKLLHNAEDKLKKLPKEIEEIEKFSKQKSEIFKEQFSQNTKESLDVIAKNSKKILEIEEKKISNDLISETLQNSVMSAKQNLADKLISDPKLHEKFIQESLEELERVKL